MDFLSTAENPISVKYLRQTKNVDIKSNGRGLQQEQINDERETDRQTHKSLNTKSIKVNFMHMLSLDCKISKKLNP